MPSWIWWRSAFKAGKGLSGHCCLLQCQLWGNSTCRMTRQGGKSECVWGRRNYAKWLWIGIIGMCIYKLTWVKDGMQTNLLNKGYKLYFCHSPLVLGERRGPCRGSEQVCAPRLERIWTICSFRDALMVLRLSSTLVKLLPSLVMVNISRTNWRGWCCCALSVRSSTILPSSMWTGCRYSISTHVQAKQLRGKRM